jgi:hypothetical protein
MRSLIPPPIIPSPFHNLRRRICEQQILWVRGLHFKKRDIPRNIRQRRTARSRCCGVQPRQWLHPREPVCGRLQERAPSRPGQAQLCQLQHVGAVSCVFRLSSLSRSCSRLAGTSGNFATGTCTESVRYPALTAARYQHTLHNHDRSSYPTKVLQPRRCTVPGTWGAGTAIFLFSVRWSRIAR